MSIKNAEVKDALVISSCDGYSAAGLIEAQERSPDWFLHFGFWVALRELFGVRLTPKSESPCIPSMGTSSHCAHRRLRGATVLISEIESPGLFQWNVRGVDVSPKVDIENNRVSFVTNLYLEHPPKDFSAFPVLVESTLVVSDKGVEADCSSLRRLPVSRVGYSTDGGGEEVEEDGWVWVEAMVEIVPNP